MGAPIERTIPLPAGPERRRTALAAGALTVVIIGITYVRLVSVWHWTEWPATTAYYGMLGEAFTQGKTYLPIEPPSELANLENPLCAGAWAPLNGPTSYYQERYYLYWGPALAVALPHSSMLGAPRSGIKWSSLLRFHSFSYSRP
jgi:hypothetical protein